MARARFTGILVAVTGAAVVYWLTKFNLSHYYGEHYLIVNLIGLFWVPMMFIFLVAREDPDRFGFSMPDTGRSWWLTLLLFAGVLLFLVPASRLHSFQSYYPLDPQAAHSWEAFLYFEISYGLYLFCWEFFFRGFLLFGLQRAIGWWAILAQAAAFGLMHYTKPTPEFIVSFPSGIILALLALRARSFFPCFVLHWASALTFDILVIAARH